MNLKRMFDRPDNTAMDNSQKQDMRKILKRFEGKNLKKRELRIL